MHRLRAHDKLSFLPACACTLALAFASGCRRNDDATSRGTTPQPATMPHAAAQRLALLVGIDHYAPSDDADRDTPPLAGAANDVKLAAELLRTRFGFEDRDIHTLLGPAATHEAIVREFHDHLIAEADADTKVVFWFAGHGSHVPDPTGLDPSPRAFGEGAQDQTIVAYDSRAVDPTGSYDITDDELRSLVAAIPAKDVVVVTDCCHSGGLLRGTLQPGTRAAAVGKQPLDRSRLSFWPAAVHFRDDDDTGLTTDLDHVVQLAACEATETAGEYEAAPQVHGVLTWFLTQALRGAGPGTSWKEVTATTAARILATPSSWQHPQAFGQLQRAVFGGIARPLPEGLDAGPYGTGRLHVAGGAVHGIVEGVELGVIALDGQRLGTARAKDVHTSECYAEWLGPGPLPDAPVRVQPERLRAQQPLLTVLTGDDVDRGLLPTTLARLPGAGERADYSLLHHGDGFQLCDVRLEPVRECAAEPDAVARMLRKESVWRSLWDFHQTPGRFPLTVWATTTKPEECARRKRPAALVRTTDPTRGAATAATVHAARFNAADKTSGGLVTIHVRNDSDTELYVAILAVTENREIHVLRGRDPGDPVAAHAEVEKVAWTGPTEAWIGAHGQRVMIDRYLAIATPRYADFVGFEAGEPVFTRGGAETELPPWLRAALGADTRGEAPTAAPWGAAFVDLLLAPPDK